VICVSLACVIVPRSTFEHRQANHLRPEELRDDRAAEREAGPGENEHDIQRHQYSRKKYEPASHVSIFTSVPGSPS
jgi:hypothetical protein